VQTCSLPIYALHKAMNTLCNNSKSQIAPLFFLEEADEWRPECWRMIRERSDLRFAIITKRIHRFMECIPDDWGEGYPNVSVYCTVENQQMADYRLPIYLELPIRDRKSVV